MKHPTHTTFAIIAIASAAIPAHANQAPGLVDQYRPAANRIINAVRAGNGAYDKLEQLCDGVGHRLSGSPQLDQAIDWAVQTMRADGHENVRKEHAMVPRWVRGRESLLMTEPRAMDLAMLGLGGSVGTPPEGLTAEVIVVRDEKELASLGRRVSGKIVLFNNIMPAYDPREGSGYGSAVKYRLAGAAFAARHGAVACLVRSVTATSLRSPHTGAMSYEHAERKVPAAAVATEDAAMIARMIARGQRVVVTLKMEARSEGEASSANVVAELRGRERSDEIVVISGHLDSWDVGQGAHDDGSGCVMAMEALTAIRRLGLTPRRTIRVVLWTNEENGVAGARQYVKDHAAELPLHAAAIEADSGGFRPTGFSFQFDDKRREAIAQRQLEEIASLLAPLGATQMRAGGSGADVGRMRPAGVPLLGLNVDGSRYFDYHHSQADTLDKVNPTDLTESTAAMAVMAYVLADMPGRLGQPE